MSPTQRPTPKPIDADIQTVAEALAERRFSVMARQARVARWSVLSVSGVVAVMAFQVMPAPIVASWWMLVLVAYVVRLVCLDRYAARPQETAEVKLRGALVTNIFFGLSFGLSAGFMFWLDRALSAVLTTLVVSMAAGAVAVSGTLPRIYLAFSLGALVPFAAVWAATGTLLGASLAVMMGMFVLLQYRFSQTVSNTFDESFMMRQRNEMLMAELTLAREKAEAANGAKTRFLAAASHDLRQPLHALSLQTSTLLLDLGADDLPATAAAIAESVADVSALLDSLLDISKLDAGTVVADCRPIHLSRMLESLGRSFKVWADSKALAFELDLLPDQITVTDPILLERILRNLVDNAIKFTPGGSVRLALSLAEGSDQFRLSVSDTGVGIPPEAQGRVFDEFYQIDRHAQGHKQGLGLGLSIVNRLARLLRIELELCSAPGQGTTITLSLPRGEAQARPLTTTPKKAEPGVGFDRLSVLVLDDEPKICNAMASLLRKLGCEVETACNLADAVASVQIFGPDIVLADYRIGNETNGIDAVARLRQDAPGLLAVLISGDTGPERLREASKSGMRLLHKPVSAEQLKATLVEMLDSGAKAGDGERLRVKSARELSVANLTG